MPTKQSKAATQKPKEVKAITASKFFYEHRELAGFENPTRALYQTVRELVENALDATDIYGILPEVTLVIEKGEKQGEYKVTVVDNGVGVPPDSIPEAFGRVLASSKYRLVQSRGRFGLGAKMAILYGQITTGKPVEVYSAPINSSRSYHYTLKIDIERNQPIILEKASWAKRGGWHGTRVTVTLKGDWGRARSRIYEYLKMTAIIAPYASIVFIDPEGRVTYYPRVTDKLPRPPREVKPHPHGVDVEMLKELIRSSKAKTLRDFLVEAFQGVGKKTAEQFLREAGLDPNMDPKQLLVDDRRLAELAEKLHNYKKFRAPSADALSPLGPELIEAGLKAILKPEFVVAVTRKPKAYRGHPFIVEVGLAYGGAIPPSDEPILLRFANKIPLLYDEKSDVAWKVVNPSNFNWKQYLVDFPAPIAVLTHICSTKVPYRGVGKESVADVPEIENELRLALREAAKKLRAYLLKKRKEEETRKRIVTFMKYVPEVAESLAVILKGEADEEKIRQALLEALKKKLGLSEEEFNKLVKGFEVEVEE